MNNIKSGEAEKAREEFTKAIDAYFHAYSISKYPTITSYNSICEAIIMGIQQGKTFC